MFIPDAIEFMGETLGSRPENLGNIIKATKQHYRRRATIVVGNTTTDRQAACVEEIGRAVEEITRNFRIGIHEITLYTYPRGNHNLPPVPVTSPGLIPRQQRRGTQLEDRSTSQPIIQEEPKDQTITLEELQDMSPGERAKKIRELRILASLSQESLAKMSQLSINTLRKLESRTQDYEPSEDILENVVKGLTTALDLLQKTDEQLLKRIPNLTAQEIVYELLNARNISYPDLAHRLGRSRSSIDKLIGQKTRRLTREVAKEICDAIGLDEDNPFRLHILEKIDIEDDERRLAERARRSESTVLFQS